MVNIDELLRLHAAATQGEWCYDGMHNEITTPSGESYWLIVSECRSAPDQEIDMDRFGHHHDANFAAIAALHNAFPSLAAELVELRNKVSAMEARDESRINQIELLSYRVDEQRSEIVRLERCNAVDRAAIRAEAFREAQQAVQYELDETIMRHMAEAEEAKK